MLIAIDPSNGSELHRHPTTSRQELEQLIETSADAYQQWKDHSFNLTTTRSRKTRQTRRPWRTQRSRRNRSRIQALKRNGKGQLIWLSKMKFLEAPAIIGVIADGSIQTHRTQTSPRKERTKCGKLFLGLYRISKV